MPFTVTNDFLTGSKPVRSASGSEVLVERFTLNLATADLALNTIGAIGILPAGHVPVGLRVDSADLDSNGTPLVSMSVGILDAAGTALSTTAADGGAAWATGITISRTGGAVDLPSRPMHTVASASSDRRIGVLVSAAAATAVAGELAVTLFYRAA